MPYYTLVYIYGIILILYGTYGIYIDIYGMEISQCSNWDRIIYGIGLYYTIWLMVNIN